MNDPYLYRPINVFDLNNFWNWPYLIDYIFTLSLFGLSMAFISNVIGYDNKHYVAFLGVACASVEGLLGVPQVYNNFIKKNTDTLSFFMIITWALGDSFKTFYFFISNSPIQLLACGIFQFFENLLVSFVIRESSSIIHFWHFAVCTHSNLKNTLDIRKRQRSKQLTALIIH